VSGDMTDVRLQIAFANVYLPSGDGTRGCGLAALRRLGIQFHFSRGGGERLLAMPPTSSSPLKARFVHLSWLQHVAFAPCLTQTPPLTARFVHPSWLQP